MWIMSQDESKIVEIKNEVEVQGCTIQTLTNIRWTKIGEYKTEVRAKEVLGRMFSAMQNGGTTFEMPEETAR